MATARAPLFVLSIALGICALASPTAAAQPQPSADDSNRSRALELYEEGSRLLQHGDPKASLAPLETSMDLLPSPNTELLLGHALRQLGDKALALTRYAHVRAGATARIERGETRFAPTLADAERWIAKLSPEVADLTVNVTGAPRDAVLMVRGRRLRWLDGSSGSVRTARTYEEPGVADIEIRVSGRSVARTNVELTKGVARLVTLDAGDTSSSPEPVEDTDGGIAPPPIAAWVAGSIGVGGMLSFAVAGGVALDKANELDACAPRCDPNDLDAQSARDTGETAALVANVSVGVGAAGVLTGALLWIFWPDEERPAPSVTLDVGPGSFGMRGRF